MQHVVIGAGEVGAAVAEVLSAKHNVFLRDLVEAGPTRADILHICFPYSLFFSDYVNEYRQHYEPSLVIVHSTVPLGTCSTLGVVASPVRGRHPALAESIRQFVKFFGGTGAQAAADLFEACGVRTVVARSAEDVEAGKMWELAQYGLVIAIEKAIHAYCETNRLDFNTVYTQFAQTYNEGYSALGEPQFVRPLLKHMPGPIGGHCVVPGSLMLNHPLASLVAEAR